MRGVNGFFLAVLFVYMVTSCFYIFKSGLPQPSDFLLALGIGAYALIRIPSATFRINPVYLLAVCFGVYTGIINLINYAFFPDLQLLLSSLYYIFNASIFIFIAALIRKNPNKSLKLIYGAIFLATIAQFAVVELFPNFRGSRQTGTFFNPNQLAIWSLLMAMMLVTIRSYSRFRWYDFIPLLILGYFQTLAVSKAGLVCYMLLMGSLFFSGAVKFNHKVAGGFLILIVCIYGVFEYSRLYQNLAQFENIGRTISKIETIGEEVDDNPTSRGYTRIMQYPQYAFVGAGEGAFYRFDDQAKKREIHSSIGALLFGYGFLGLGFFLCLLYCIAKVNRKHITVLLLIYLLNGMVHQNVRFSTFWVMLGLMYGMGSIHSEMRTRYQAEKYVLNQGDMRVLTAGA